MSIQVPQILLKNQSMQILHLSLHHTSNWTEVLGRTEDTPKHHVTPSKKNLKEKGGGRCI